MAWGLLLGACFALPPPALAAVADSSLEIRTLQSGGPEPSAPDVASGTLDRSFAAPASQASLRQVPDTHWVRLQATRSIAASAIPVVVVGASRYLRIAVFPRGIGTPARAARVTVLPAYGGTRETAFQVPGAHWGPARSSTPACRRMPPRPTGCISGWRRWARCWRAGRAMR